MNIYLQVQNALTPAERDLFLAGLVRMSPRLNGAHVADALEMLDNGDENLSEVEPMHERHGAEVKTRGLLTAATHVVWFWHRALPAVPFSDEQVLALCRRVEV